MGMGYDVKMWRGPGQRLWTPDLGHRWGWGLGPKGIRTGRKVRKGDNTESECQ